MVRVKRAVMQKKRHKNILAKTKGYRLRRNNVFRQAKTAVLKAGFNAYKDRRDKKRTFRALWNVRINAAVRPLGTTYSKFIHAMYLKKVALNRKVLSNLAITNPETFKAVVAFVK